MSKIQLFIHGGFQKCATTYLQEKIFYKLKNFYCLSKPFSIYGANLDPKYDIVENNKEINDEKKLLISLQEKAFPRKYSLEINKPLNTSFYIDQYKNILLRIIEKNKDKKFILSDETIFDKINYFGTQNIFHILDVTRFLQENLEIDIKFILTIRRQDQILPSIYSFDYLRQKEKYKSFEYFAKVFVDKKQEYHEIFDYYKFVGRLKKIFQNEILILPLEKLEEDPKSYHEDLFNFCETPFDDNLIYQEKVKKNSDDKKNFYLKRVRFYFLYSILSKIHKQLVDNRFYMKLYGRLRPFLKRIKSFMKANPTRKLKIDQDILLNIRESFKDSNLKLAKDFKIDLKKYNYY